MNPRRREDQANLREEISLVRPPVEIFEFHRQRSDDVPERRLEAPPVHPKRLRLVSELTPIAPATVPGTADPPMAPGTGGFNIELPRPKANRVLQFDFAHALASQSSQQVEQGSTSGWISAASLFINMLAVGGIMLVALFIEAPKLPSAVPTQTMPLPEHTSTKAITSPARLLIEHQRGIVNEPLPLGILLTNSTGEEIVRVSGLVTGTELSLGWSVGRTDWMVSHADIEKTFVGAPQDFVGMMDVTVELLSGSGLLIDRQVLRLEWFKRKNEDVLVAPIAGSELDSRANSIPEQP